MCVCVCVCVCVLVVSAWITELFTTVHVQVKNPPNFQLHHVHCLLSLLQKFKALEKRTNETTRRSTEKRIKHLQKTALENGKAFHYVCDNESG